jgi:ATP-dependent DNA helicase PIF1
MDRLRELAPALATLFEGWTGGEVPRPLAGQVSLEQLCARAPGMDELNEEQKGLVFKMFTNHGFDLEGTQVLITGPAGSGKSTLLRFFMRYFAEQDDCVPILLAPSGVAANNIGGHTIHRFFNIPRTEASGAQPECDPVRLALRLREITCRDKKPVLLIDEVSMVSLYLLEVVSQGLRLALNRDSAFGGCTVMMFGDFAQLGPVGKGGKVPYMWETGTNDYLVLKRYELEGSVRQEQDHRFLVFLKMIRFFNNSDIGQREILARFIYQHQWDDSVDRKGDFFFLFSKVDRTKDFNQSRLDELAGEPIVFMSEDGLGVHSTKQQKLITELQTGFPTVLPVKVGARVMCLSNLHIEAGVVNGALGSIVEIKQGRSGGVMDAIIRVDFDGRGEIDLSAECRSVLGKSYSRTQFPLSLAWASTIHKCQSLTLDQVCISFANMFTSGLLYVALSRVRRHSDIRFIDVPEQVGHESIDFASVELPGDVAIHVKKIDEKSWREETAARMPGLEFAERHREVSPSDDDPTAASMDEKALQDEFYLPSDEEERVDALMEEYNNDDFFLDEDSKGEEEDEEEEEPLRRTFYASLKAQQQYQ